MRCRRVITLGVNESVQIVSGLVQQFASKGKADAPLFLKLLVLWQQAIVGPFGSSDYHRANKLLPQARRLGFFYE
jgi:hypothetical protein